MRRYLVIAALTGLACVPGLAFSDGFLSLYADPGFTQCTLSDTTPRTVNIYLVELPISGATGIRVRIAADPGFTGVWLDDASPFATVGDSQTDFSAGFGTCENNRFLVLTMTYQLFGTSTCIQLSIAAVSGFIYPICTDCSFGQDNCSGVYPLHINCDGSFGCSPLAVESATWGAVKALYR
ncbi:MAG TPA: hypothetical protein VFH88_13670 [Candidatus Krumholzibacteria bacterium]|nr:hypothetical protein [Candidatus Krumholzibacteria bacterium]